MKPLPELAGQHPELPLVHDGTVPLPEGLRGGVMLLGSFDGMHRGHAALVAAGRETARRSGGPLSILQCDPHPRGFFAGASRFRVSTGAAQMRMLADAGLDYVYAPRFDAVFAGMPAEEFVLRVLVDHLGIGGVVVGRDFRFGRNRDGDVALLAALSASLPFSLTVVEDETDGGCRISTSAVRHAIAAGDIGAGTVLLGHGWLTEISCTGADRWRFAADQILPPPGRWAVAALDLAGRHLADCVLELDAAGTAHMAAPPGTALITWLPAAGEQISLKPEIRGAHARL
ncbi:hypothetical protein [Xaviernesmea oryzae]|uniref:FAD synthase n=1 Tax=Xaviernesmea oryzae TaxID=464029 RepID=A0A1X7DIZ1_9HYPH|nr:hypothetical protein [Xaviernesmea oryzae]SMF16509.1 riboflavin kinase / FMN adenylyltransferase [Xaviernesmea oryzae]